MSHRKTDLGIPSREKSAKVVLIGALLRIGRNAFRYAGITLSIVMLVARAEPAWMIAVLRFLEISVGIAVGLLLTAVWPETEPAAARSQISKRNSSTS